MHIFEPIRNNPCTCTSASAPKTIVRSDDVAWYGQMYCLMCGGVARQYARMREPRTIYKSHLNKMRPN